MIGKGTLNFFKNASLRDRLKKNFKLGPSSAIYAGLGGLSGAYLGNVFSDSVVGGDPKDVEAQRKRKIRNTIIGGLAGAGLGGVAGARRDRINQDVRDYYDRYYGGSYGGSRSSGGGSRSWGGPPKKSAKETLYEALGIDPSSNLSDSELKKRYRDFMRKNHPDLNQGSQASNRASQTVNAAYQAWKDSQ